MNTQADQRSDVLVLFGATGDLAYKKIFPALQALTKRGRLDMPVVGVAKSGWNLDQLVARAKASVSEHGGLDQPAFDKLVSNLRYVDGDYGEQTAATVRAFQSDRGLTVDGYVGSESWPALLS